MFVKYFKNQTRGYQNVVDRKRDGQIDRRTTWKQYTDSMHRFRKFYQRGPGPTLTCVFFFFFNFIYLVDEGREDPYTTIHGPSFDPPSLTCQRNAIKWCFAGRDNDGPAVQAWYLCDLSGDRDQFARKPYIFVIFQGGGGSGPSCPSPPPSLDLHMGRDGGLLQLTSRKSFPCNKKSIIFWTLELND